MFYFRKWHNTCIISFITILLICFPRLEHIKSKMAIWPYYSVSSLTFVDYSLLLSSTDGHLLMKFGIFAPSSLFCFYMWNTLKIYFWILLILVNQNLISFVRIKTFHANLSSSIEVPDWPLFPRVIWTQPPCQSDSRLNPEYL